MAGPGLGGVGVGGVGGGVGGGGGEGRAFSPPDSGVQPIGFIPGLLSLGGGGVGGVGGAGGAGGRGGCGERDLVPEEGGGGRGRVGVVFRGDRGTGGVDFLGEFARPPILPGPLGLLGSSSPTTTSEAPPWRVLVSPPCSHACFSVSPSPDMVDRYTTTGATQNKRTSHTINQMASTLTSPSHSHARHPHRHVYTVHHVFSHAPVARERHVDSHTSWLTSTDSQYEPQHIPLVPDIPNTLSSLSLPLSPSNSLSLSL